MPQVVDPIFSKALIYMINHDINGSLGLIVNKKINQLNYKTIKNFFPNEKILLSEASDDLFFGGPIITKENIIIHSSTDKSIKPLITSINKSGTTNEQYLHKKITGFSSWGPGQLDREIKNGDWIPQEKQDHIIFSSTPENDWEDLMKSIGINTIEIGIQGAQA